MCEEWTLINMCLVLKWMEEFGDDGQIIVSIWGDENCPKIDCDDDYGTL